jgi:hypothetical protein
MRLTCTNGEFLKIFVQLFHQPHWQQVVMGLRQGNRAESSNEMQAKRATIGNQAQGTLSCWTSKATKLSMQSVYYT